MKILKIFLYFILFLVVVLLIAIIAAPSEKVVERSITIDAPIETVYNVLLDHKQSENWDPWSAMDSTVVRTYEGAPGDDKYGYSWKGEKLGTGSLYVTSTEENKSIYQAMNLNDWNMDMTAYFELEPDGEGTKVVWGMKSVAGFPFKVFHYGTEAMMGKDYEQGLKNLKEYIENNDDLGAVTLADVEMVSEFGVNYAVIRQLVSFKDMEAVFNGGYAKIYPYLAQNGIEPKGPPSAMYYTWDPENSQSNMAVAVPISEYVPVEVEMDSIDIGEVAISDNSIAYTMIGGYEKSEQIHNALGAWIEANNKEYVMPVMEQYIKGPANEQDPSKYETVIIYHFSSPE